MKRPYFLLLLAVVAAGVFVVWQSPGSRAVTAVTPRRAQAVELVYATGVIEPVNQTAISTQSAGELVALLVDEGASIEAGRALARLDSTTAQQKVDELAAKLAWDEKELERAKALRQRGAGSQEALDDAESRMAQTRAQLEAAKDQLARRTLISPVAGIVLRRDGEVGEYLQAGQTVFTVGNADTLRAELEVDEEDIPQVVRGQRVLLTADAFPGRVFEASVSEVTPLGDTLNKSYRVRAAVPAGTSIPAGMTVEANIVLREKPDALLIPASAVSAGSVFVVEKGHAVSRKIELGIQGAEEAEILSGIPADALVIVEPPSDLKDGERVRAVR